MAEKKNGTLQVLVAAFVMLILALAFLSTLSDQTAVNVERTVVTDEVQALAGCWVRVNMSAETVDGPIWAQVNGTFTDADCNFTVTHAPTDWKQADCQLTSIVLTNRTSGTTVWTDGTDYEFDEATGQVALYNTTNTRSWLNTTNGTLVSYQYCADNYVSSSLGRTMLETTLGLLALAILIVVVAVVYKSIRETD